MSDWIVCHDCDALLRLPPVSRGKSAFCIRCGAVVHRRKRNSIDRTLALTIAALVLFALANLFPFLSLEAGGIVSRTNLAGGVAELYRHDQALLAVLVCFTALAFPLVEMCSLLYLLLPLRFGRIPAHFAPVLRSVTTIRPWGMMEIYMLGVLVSLVKLAETAQVIPGLALFAYGALIVILTAATFTLDIPRLWELYGDRR